MNQHVFWSMPSNSGYSETRFTVTSVNSEDGNIEFSIAVTQAESGENLNRYDLMLRRMPIAKLSCENLLMDFELWLTYGATFTRDMETYLNSSIQFQLHQREGFTPRDDQPVFTFAYSVGSMQLQYAYVVDETCVRIAADGLRTVLGNIGES